MTFFFHTIKTALSIDSDFFRLYFFVCEHSTEQPKSIFSETSILYCVRFEECCVDISASDSIFDTSRKVSANEVTCELLHTSTFSFLNFNYYNND